MSVPHEIEYSLLIRSPGRKAVDNDPVRSENSDEPKKPHLSGLTHIDDMELSYTSGFSVSHYEDNKKNRYSFITIKDGDMSGETTQYFLLSPGGKGDISLLEENKKRTRFQRFHIS